MRIENSSSKLQDRERRVEALNLALASGEELDDACLLEIILDRHLGHEAAAGAARRLLERFSHLGNIVQSELDTLLEVEGLTLSAAAAILQIRHLTKAVYRSEIRNCVLLDSHSKLMDYCRTLLANAKQEEFHALFLDRRGELQGEECIQRGTIDHVFVYPRELFKQAIRHHASFIILVHNHPFGKARPSRTDVTMTLELSSLAQAIGAQVFDHIIISPGDVFSFRKNALLPAAPVEDLNGTPAK